MPSSLIASWLERRPDVRLFNEYGPTECSVLVTGVRCSASISASNSGKPLDGVQAYILDAYMQPVPVGVTGMLYIAGPYVARGYLNQPAKTAEVFVRNPFSQDPEAIMYNTGDVFRWLPDGSMEYLGRRDGQVKLRGFRIELGEIESVMLRWTRRGVRACAAVVREDQPGQKRLVAYVEVGGDVQLGPSDWEDLRSHVGKFVPSYMVPSAFVQVAVMPKTSSGKTDRKRLPAPVYEGDSKSLVAARNETEALLLQLATDTLRVRVGDFGMSSNFFESGGSSLSASILLSRVREALGLVVTVSEFFAQPTVEYLASRLASSAKSATAAALQIKQRDSSLFGRGSVPLSAPQRRLWFIYQQHPDSPMYNIPFALRVRGALDVGRLEQAIAQVVMRHEALHTSFDVDEQSGLPVQCVLEDVSFRLERMDLCGQAESGSDACQAAVQREMLRAFRLDAKSLPVRGLLIRVSADEHVLVVTAHHIAFDGGSVGVFWREVDSCYRGETLSPLVLQYGDFAAWQHELVKSDVYQSSLGYWKQKLGSDPEPLSLPTVFARPPVVTSDGASCSLTMRDLAGPVQGFVRAKNLTPTMFYLGCYAVLLHRYTGQETILLAVRAQQRELGHDRHVRGDFSGASGFRVRRDFRGSASAGPSELVGSDGPRCDSFRRGGEQCVDESRRVALAACADDAGF